MNHIGLMDFSLKAWIFITITHPKIAIAYPQKNQGFQSYAIKGQFSQSHNYPSTSTTMDMGKSSGTKQWQTATKHT